MPSKKRNTNIVAEKKEKTRFLSKAQRKRLEKIVDKKKKKENVSFTLIKKDLLCNLKTTNPELPDIIRIQAQCKNQ